MWYAAPRTVRLEREMVASPTGDEVLVSAAWSAISRGTERLVFSGLTDPCHRERMRSPMQVGEFPFPVKYGYCSVGEVIAGPERLVGRHVFVFHPHQDRFLASLEAVTVIPDALPPRRATLAANMETALNTIWDSGAGPGDRIVIVGAGLVGLLVTYLAARLPGTEVTAIDPNPARRAVVERFGARYRDTALPGPDADVVIHASATAEGLETALACCATEATLVEASWYGDAAVTVRLGGAFHAKRLRVVSSQVGAVPLERRARWSRRRRLAKALDLLADDRLDALITHEVNFSQLPERMEAILDGAPDAVATVIRY
uniref:zinc-dependent alcohol dehydrogenase n=2 Tax=Aquabacter sp. L1I39 TaxID=2820278 RepID=UPI00315850A7